MSRVITTRMVRSNVVLLSATEQKETLQPQTYLYTSLLRVTRKDQQPISNATLCNKMQIRAHHWGPCRKGLNQPPCPVPEKTDYVKPLIFFLTGLGLGFIISALMADDSEERARKKMKSK